jgi:flagellar secretion chaperone FliS
MESLSNEIIYKKNPQELTALLYEGMLENLEESIEYIDSKNYIEANKKIQKASDILHRLGVGLKYEAGVIAEQLDTLYNYMANRLVEANLKKDRQMILDVLKVLQPIVQAWNVALKSKPSQNNHLIRKVSAYEDSIMRTEN